MPAWKVLLIGLCGFICLGLATATVIVPFSFDGAERWAWLAGLVAGTAAAGGLFALFLRHAGRAMGPVARGSGRG